MKYRPLDVVVLARDLADHRLCEGDLGAVVEVYESDTLDVEFVLASGRTGALVTLHVSDLRPVGDRDMPAVRRQAGSSDPPAPLS